MFTPVRICFSSNTDTTQLILTGRLKQVSSRSSVIIVHLCKYCKNTKQGKPYFLSIQANIAVLHHQSPTPSALAEHFLSTSRKSCIKQVVMFSL